MTRENRAAAILGIEGELTDNSHCKERVRDIIVEMVRETWEGDLPTVLVRT